MLVIAIPTAFALSGMFSDIPLDQWYSSAIENLSEKGIIKGYPDKTFRPSNNVNRAELAIMFDRLIEQQQTLQENCGRLDTFKDYPWFSSLNQKYTNEFLKPLNIEGDLAALYGKGCFTTNGDTLVFMPGQNAFGCHEIFKFDTHKNTLEKAKTDKEYCANHFTHVGTDTISFSGENGEGGVCQKDKGKYLIEENVIEFTSSPC